MTRLVKTHQRKLQRSFAYNLGAPSAENITFDSQLVMELLLQEGVV